jgi:hypothetical protein
MKKTATLFLVFSALCFGQVYAVTVTNAGSGYTSAPAVTASGGTCVTTQPTFSVALNGTGPYTVGSVNVTFAGAGCTPGGAAPALAFSGGGGSGAAATAVMLQASIALLDSPLVQSDQNPSPTITGTYRLYRYECTLVVPATFVPFYSSTYSTATTDRMPNTSQASQILWGVVSGAAALQALYNSAYSAGILTAYDGAVTVASATTLATVEATVVTDCANWQTALNAWNPWGNYATYYNGTAWTAATIL